ncbi:MAG: LysM peptidoglycan-binding domain-containing protein [Egibacteraceae bacterium]
MRDHQDMDRWIVSTPVPEHETALHDALHAGYRTWLRTTAAAGLASALLVAPAATAAASSARGDSASAGQGGLDGFDASTLLLQDTQGQQPGTAGLTDTAPLAIGVPEDQPPPAELTEPAGQPLSLDRAHTASARPYYALPLEIQTPPPLEIQAPPPLEIQTPPPDPAPSASEDGAPQAPRPGESSPQGSPPGSPQGSLTSQRWVTMMDRALDAVEGDASAATPALVTRSEVTATPTLGWSYMVQAGDSLWGISERVWADQPSNDDVDRTWRVLYEWNSTALGSDPDQLRPGQVLEIPVESSDMAEAP